MTERVLAIDFGTSFTTAAMRVGAEPVLVEIDEKSRLPSAVFLEDDGRIAVGWTAEAHAAGAPDRFERAPKRYLGKRAMILGGEPVRVAEAVGAVLDVVWEESLARFGGTAPGEVRLTHPASWGAERRGALGEAAGVAGIADPVFVPEPVAAAVHLADEHVHEGEPVAVYDLGGGTFDTTVLRRTTEAFEIVGSPGGIDRLGGEDFDQRLYLHLGEALASVAPEAWEALRFSEERSWRKANIDFLAEARRAKETLSRATSAAIYLGAPVDRELRITRPEFESLVRADIEATVRVLDETLGRAGVAKDGLAALYLVGGSSRIPLVSRLVGDFFGRTPSTWGDPKTVVALGAVRAAPRTVAPVAGAPGGVAPAALSGVTPVAAASPPGVSPGVVPAGVAPAAPVPPPPPGSPPGSRPLGGRLPLFAVGGAVVALLVVAGVVLALRGGGGKEDRKPTPATTAAAAAATRALWVVASKDGMLNRVNPGTGEVMASISVGEAPLFAVADGDDLWVTVFDSSQVVRVDTTENEVTAEVPAGGQPRGVDVADGVVWVGVSDTNSVMKIDAASGDVLSNISVGGQPYGVAVGAGSVWVALNDTASLARIDPDTDEVAATITVDADPEGVAVDGDSVWVACSDSGVVDRVDVKSEEVESRTKTGEQPSLVAIGDGAVWVTVYEADVLARLDPRTGRVTKRTEVNSPWGLSVVDDAVWVSDFEANEILKVDPRTGAVVDRIADVGIDPVGVVATQAR